MATCHLYNKNACLAILCIMFHLRASQVWRMDAWKKRKWWSRKCQFSILWEFRFARPNFALFCVSTIHFRVTQTLIPLHLGSNLSAPYLFSATLTLRNLSILRFLWFWLGIFLLGLGMLPLARMFVQTLVGYVESTSGNFILHFAIEIMNKYYLMSVQMFLKANTTYTLLSWWWVKFAFSCKFIQIWRFDE